jgi:hypothetical protein
MQWDRSNSLWFYPLGLATHYLIAVVGGMLIGFIPEAMLSSYYRFSSIRAFAPAIGFTALFSASLPVSGLRDFISLVGSGSSG